MSSRTERTEHMSSNDFGAADFFEKCPETFLGHVPDMSLA